MDDKFPTCSRNVSLYKQFCSVKTEGEKTPERSRAALPPHMDKQHRRVLAKRSFNHDVCTSLTGESVHCAEQNPSETSFFISSAAAFLIYHVI